MRGNERGEGVVVTGLGLVTAHGSGVAPVWRSLLRGVDPTGPLVRFPADGYRVRSACQVTDTAAGGAHDAKVEITWRAAHEAAVEAGILPLRDPRRVGVMVGTLGPSLNCYEDRVRAGGDASIDPAMSRRLMPGGAAGAVASALGCEGRVGTVLTACAAGSQALLAAGRWIAAGHADVMLVGGSEIITQTQYTHFHNLRALSPDVCRPFDRHRRGLVLGEGAAFLVLEAEQHARRRGAPLLARLLGGAQSCDAYHMTAPDPAGDGAGRAIRGALADAGVAAGDVDYVSAHGTGTPLNDRVEARVLRDVFGPDVVASSVKSMTGHCMGASSAIESAVCVLTLRDRVVPPTIHFEEPDPECPLDCVPNDARALDVRVAMNVSFAFGGNNCAVVLAAHD
jgi:3-oxoacyl-[acyl-carrier-protein] synthase II